MEKILGASWKTTLGGVLASVGLALLAIKMPDGYQWIGPVIAAVGSGLIGAAAKDSNVHSTQAEVKVATEEKKVEKQEAIAEIKEKK